MNAQQAVPKIPGAFYPDNSTHKLSSSYLSDREGLPEGFSVHVADTIEAVEELRPIWKKWPLGLDADIDYFLHNLKSDPTILCPYVITVCREGVPQAMLVGQVKKRTVSTVVSYLDIRGPQAKVLEVENGGRMNKKSDAIDRLLAMQLLRASKCAGVDLLLFQRLPLKSELFRELQQRRSRLIRLRVPHISCYSVLPLTAPAGKRATVFQGKYLRETRRKTRILQRAFPDGVKFKCYYSPGELDLGIRDATTVSATSWQPYLGPRFLSDAQTQSNLGFCARRGWLRVYVMYINDTPCSFLIGQLYERTFYCQHAGYNHAFAKFSVGSLLTAWALENLAAAGVAEVDLGKGGQEHNRRLGCRVREEGAVHVYFPTLRGLQANIFFAAAQIVRVAGRKTINELRLKRASKVWSQFLIVRWRARNRVGYLRP
jgi:hypothetical protein